MKITDNDKNVVEESPHYEASSAHADSSSVSLTAELVKTVPTDDVPLEVLMCRAYCKCGSIAEVARAFGTSYYEVAKHSRTTWWADEEVRFKKDQASQLDAALTESLDAAVGALLDRITLGEIDGVNKDGSLRRKPMSASVLARVVDTTFRTRQLIRNQPTSIQGDTDKMGILANKLRALGAKDVTLLDGEVTDVDSH
jgi:hypothetical protein